MPEHWPSVLAFLAKHLKAGGRSILPPAVRTSATPRSFPGGRYCAPPGALIFSITWSRLKLAAFCRGGNSLKVARNSAT